MFVLIQAIESVEGGLDEEKTTPTTTALELLDNMEDIGQLQLYNGNEGVSPDLGEDNLTDGIITNQKQLSNGGIDPDDLMRQLEKENRDYQEQKLFISQQLSALKTQMYDLRKEDGGGVSGGGASIGMKNGGIEQDQQEPGENNQIHVSLVRQTSHKHIAYNKVGYIML